jgi:hypothetical protein
LLNVHHSHGSNPHAVVISPGAIRDPNACSAMIFR